MGDSVTSTNIPKRFYLPIAAVCGAAGAAVTCALTVGPHPVSYVAVGLTAAAVAWWVRWMRGLVLPIVRLRGRIADARADDPPEADIAAVCDAIGREIESGRLALTAMLRTCYSLVAAVNDTETVSLKVKREVFSRMGELEESIVGLRGALVTLKELKPDGGGSGPPPAKVSELVDEISSSLEDMTVVLTDVHHDARELLSAAGEASYSISRLDSFLHDMVRSGKQLETSTETSSRVAREAIKVVEEMEKENQATIASVKKAAKSAGTLGMWSQEIGKIIQVIKDIADETNLLALNVAIIASQAGEHGKAFGVVAEEIRGLAERTSSSTKEISDLITTVQTSVSNVVEEMKESVGRVERGEVLVGNAGRVIEKISDSFESARSIAHELASKTSEHRMDSNHVVRSFQNVAEIARRLDASRTAKGAMSGRGAAAAQMLKVLSGAMAPAAREKVAVGEYVAFEATRAGGVSAGGPGPSSHAGDPADVIERGVGLLDGVHEYIGSVRKGLGAYFDAVSNTASLVRSVARQLRVPDGPSGFERCWEVLEHCREARCSCPEYGRDDWRCFLADGVDRTLCGGVGNRDGCYACPVFQANMERLLPESECPHHG